MNNVAGKKALVVGLGKSGISAIRFLAERGAMIVATDMKQKTELADTIKTLADLKIEYELGKHPTKIFTEADFIVLSPGVPSNLEGIEEARIRGIPIINDIELAGTNSSIPVIAITGSNGKTTTATLIAEMLKACGKKVFLGGNIGTPALDYFNKRESADYMLLEVSSFQCESLINFKPDVAVITNLEPNHLDRYASGVDAYYAAKKKLLKNADANTILVSNCDNDNTAQLLIQFQGIAYGFTKRNPMTVNPTIAENFQGAYLHKPKFTIRQKNGEDKTFTLLTSKLPGDHNRENIMTAALTVNALNCAQTGIQKVIDLFRGVPNRLEFVRKKDGVFFYNDSKSTSVPALRTALNAFISPVILIAGGKDKDQIFSPLAEMVKKRVKVLILLGEAKEKINREIGDFTETYLVGTFEEAILIAYQKSRNGDVILLSPGCASYDMFKNYEERGDYFKKLVAQL